VAWRRGPGIYSRPTGAPGRGSRGRRRTMNRPDQGSTALAVRSKAPRRPLRLGLRERSRLRRRVRFLRKQRELQMRDLGGLIFDMYRFGSKRQDLVREKLRLMFEADRELREFEAMLGGRRPPLEVREAGVAGSCPRCLTLYSTDAHYCWRCGLPLTEQAERSTIVDVDDLDAGEPRAEDPPHRHDSEATVETDAVTPAASPNGAAAEEPETEIEAARLASRSADASRP
jgi:hypothetical protein